MLILIGLIVVTGILLTTASVQNRLRWLRGGARSLLVTYFTVVLLLVAGEAYFRFVHAESDGLPTLASRNWLARYWKTNSAGFRDKEWDQTEHDRTVLLVGDSFAAGWGLEDIGDRFGDVLAAHLSNQYTVVNLGKEGASTADEIGHLQTYPDSQVEVVILQYYLNDIENAALSIGLDPHLDPTEEMPNWVAESYLANFIYWRLVARFRPQQQGTQTYWDWLYSMYDNATVWAIHRDQLKAFAEATAAKGARLMVVIFPNMMDPTRSVAYVDRVAQAFEVFGYGDGIIKLFDAAEAMPLSERIVSERDAHASAAFNHLVGDLIYGRMQALGWAN